MGKKHIAALGKVDRTKAYTITEAVNLVKETAYTKFDCTVDFVMRLGIDPKKSDQLIRGAVPLPHGTGKTERILVFAKGEKVKEAQDAGADFVGGDELVEKIQKENWLDFDKVVSTPDMMKGVGKLGKILGPKNLMPNPKIGTVTMDVATAVRELKAGRVQVKVDKGANVHTFIGKVSFQAKQLEDNFKAIMDFMMKNKPSGAKGVYIKSATISATMGPGVKVDISSFS